MLGGHALMLGPQDVQLGVNETMQDTCEWQYMIGIVIFVMPLTV
jgi:ornithine carbamoyltransferase